jgi:zinc protease
VIAALLLLAPLQAAAEPPDRSAPPRPGPAPAYQVAAPERALLSNGLPVLILPSHEVPLADVLLVVRCGAAADPADLPGLAAWTAAMLDEGAGGRDALALADAVDGLGARLTTGATWDSSVASLHVPVARLELGLELLGDVALRPTFLEEEWDRLREERRTAFVQDRDDPATLARLASARAVFGPTHRYGIALEGTPGSLERAQLADLRRFHRAYYRPDHAFLVVAGDVTRDTLLPLLERRFGSWKAEGRVVPPPALPPPPSRQGRDVVIVDKPGSSQSVLSAVHEAPAGLRPLDPENAVMNTLLGGSFSSRLNANLREEHGYAYGARSGFDLREHGGLFRAASAVATDVTAPAARELVRELERIRTPAAPPEVERARAYLALTFPTNFETGADRAGFWAEADRLAVPEDSVRRFMERAGSVDPESVRLAAVRDVHPERMRLVVVGDAAEIRAALEGLGLGPVTQWTVDTLLPGPPPPP